jgi:hypothetical protein
MKTKLFSFLSLFVALTFGLFSPTYAAVTTGITQPISVPYNNPTLTTFTIPAVNPNNYLLRGDGSLVSGSDLAAVISGGGSGVTGSGLAVFQTAPTIITPVISTGLTASGSAANDFSASTGAFKASSGATTLPNLTSNGLVTTSGGTGLLSVTATTGSGSAVLATSPTLVTPTLGAASATSIAVNGGIAQHLVINTSTSGQTPAATTRTYITGSAIAIPATGLQVGTVLHWHFDMTKTAAGSASSTIDIAFGTAGTTADTAQVSFTKPAGTAASDEAFCEVECVIKTINASTGVAIGEFTMGHNLSATGHATIPFVAVNTTSGSFNTVSPTFVGLCITTGASDAITINQVSSYALNM